MNPHGSLQLEDSQKRWNRPVEWKLVRTFVQYQHTNFDRTGLSLIIGATASSDRYFYRWSRPDESGALLARHACKARSENSWICARKVHCIPGNKESARHQLQNAAARSVSIVLEPSASVMYVQTEDAARNLVFRPVLRSMRAQIQAPRRFQMWTSC